MDSGFTLNGPYDISDPSAPKDVAVFGSICFVPSSLVTVRAEIEEGTGRMVALSFDYQDSTLQVQAFASPKGESLWEDVLSDITANLESQGVSLERHLGPFGAEIYAHIPISQDELKPVRMFGLSGDRWLLRGVISGSAVTELESKNELESVFRSIVIRRGQVPLPPRELLPLSLPEGAIVPKAN
ncbi:MAG: DUF3710 domain-containing protein [Micrococcales bacterium]|nr:DUF3710 domain-containing protein [Micrococcales bacterium]